MSQFLVNGVERSWPIPMEATVAELLSYIEKNFNSERTLVANVRINGMEVSAREEQTMAKLPASTLNTIEVLTVHPRELAEETLQSLIPYAEHLARLALRAADSKDRSGSTAAFAKLVEGLGTFSSALDNVQGILRSGGNLPELPAIREMEITLIETLKRIAQARTQNRTEELSQLLETDLVAALANWHDHGLPSLIRSRDS